MDSRQAQPAALEPSHGLRSKPGAWVDLALTLPIFLAYHLGVVFLRIRNASDIVTGPLLRLAEGERPLYIAITVAIGITFAGVFALLGRGEAFRKTKFVQVIAEGVAYAIAMRFFASQVVGRLFAARGITGGPFTGLIMSFGAGFYEELAFRVVLFGLGSKVLVWWFTRERVDIVKTASASLSLRAASIVAMWGIASAAIFSGVHYIGAYGDAFDLPSFTFRFVLGVLLALIYATRGFAIAVWSHALYDAWVLVL